MSEHGTRRVLLDLAVSLDGFIEGKNGETDWCIMEPDMSFDEFLDGIDTILYGRKSYDMWGQYVPEEGASEEEHGFWERIHSKEKIVFSRTAQGDDAVYVHEDIPGTVAKLKAQPGRDIWLYGGAGLITTFINEGLVDEFRLSVHPVVLGEGKPLFTDIRERLNLKLAHTRTFSSGVVQLIYHRN
ncbi:dihydrofolate reductase family protein [Bhargavaea ginsengi]|uniref:dihydrofolate reductase family protein n=1 Tax=Bhargavaea ginsengi TaxID=426757 RepID=UPI002040F4D0|nr:dihydrofolate reductase family protein [Bhargavaea ginsengi]MCM3086837.1 dihydrofolate reductase family protein [Bhargavaea ginsengi]